MPEPAPPSEVLQAIERAAAEPAGFELLERGGLEAVAALLGVRPAAVEAARSLASDPRRRGVLLDSLRRGRNVANPFVQEQALAGARSADEVLREAEARPGGRELLLEGPVEAAAILFGVHPSVVAQVRERAAG